MILGNFCINSGSGKKALGVSVLAVEHFESSNESQSLHGRDPSSRIKQLFSSKAFTSATVGHNADRSILSVHISGDCSGPSCSCTKIASHFLEHIDAEDDEESDQECPLEEFVVRHIPYLRENVTFPYMIIASQGDKSLSLTSYSEEDFRCERLGDGCYNFRDVFLSLADPESACKELSALTQAMSVLTTVSSTAATTSAAPAERTAVSPLRPHSSLHAAASCPISPPQSQRPPSSHTTITTAASPAVCTSATAMERAARPVSRTQALVQRAHRLSAALKQQLAYKPSPDQVHAGGLTLLQHGAQALLLASNHAPTTVPDDRRVVTHPGAAPATTAGEKRKASGKIVMPKRPVNAYNYYSMEYRQGLRGAKKERRAGVEGGARSVAVQGDDEKESNSSQAALSNNEWNRLVGLKWRALSDAQQRPYKILAEQDKIRYDTECAAAGIAEEDRKPRQTAYNCFVHQEKNFVKGTNVENVKARTGRHCSLRWRTMPEEERRLYQLLAEQGQPQVQGDTA